MLLVSSAANCHVDKQNIIKFFVFRWTGTNISVGRGSGPTSVWGENWTDVDVGRGTGPMSSWGTGLTLAWGGDLDQHLCGEGNWTDVSVGRGTGLTSA